MKNKNQLDYFFEDVPLPINMLSNLQPYDNDHAEEDSIFYDEESIISNINDAGYSDTKLTSVMESKMKKIPPREQIKKIDVPRTQAKLPLQSRSSGEKIKIEKDDEDDHRLKKQELKNFLPTLKRCLIRCNQSALEAMADNKEIMEFLQYRKKASLSHINNIFLKDQLLQSLSEMFQKRKLKREFQVSRVLLKNRKSFHRQIIRIKKCFIEGRLGCL